MKSDIDHKVIYTQEKGRGGEIESYLEKKSFGQGTAIIS